MHPVIYSLGISLDGFAMGPDGAFDWSRPDAEVFAAATEEVRGLSAHLLGRRLYETMLFWEDTDPAELDEAEQEFARLWQALPKIVFSTTLTEVRGSSTRLADGGLAEEVARLQAEPGEGEIAIGGPALATAAAELGLIDEYRPRYFPVLAGGGTPFFPLGERRVDLTLVESHRYDGGVLFTRYAVGR